MSHFYYEHILLEALLNSNLNSLPEKRLVFYQVVDEGELVFEVVKNCDVARAVVCQRNQFAQILVKFVTAPKLPQLITLHVV